MCGRFNQRTNPIEFGQWFQRDFFSDWKPRYNIAPTTPVATIRQNDGQSELVGLRWGLIPSWSKDHKIGYRMINARGETVAEKPSFRAAFKRRRCLVLADGYYEWRKTDSKTKQPYHIKLEDNRPFALAGLWETWKGPRESPLDTPMETCTIITTDSNDFTSEVHDRMPVILNPDDYEFWLDSDFEDKDHLLNLLKPYPSDEMAMCPISTYVNKVGNEGAECIEAVQ